MKDRDILLSPSILSGDFWKLGEQIAEIEKTGTKWLHIDVMDGLFVPSISYGMPVIESIRKNTEMFFDVHLMIEKPERYLDTFAQVGADLIDFHLEATEVPAACIAEIRKLGKKVGMAIKPGTPIEKVFPYIADVDMILVMTVEPGFGGQKLIPECLDKVAKLRKHADEKGLESLHIQVDGGINAETYMNAVNAGSDVIVAGSSVFKNNITENIEKFREMS